MNLSEKRYWMNLAGIKPEDINDDQLNKADPAVLNSFIKHQTGKDGMALLSQGPYIPGSPSAPQKIEDVPGAVQSHMAGEITPENTMELQHPRISVLDRMKIKNLGGENVDAVKYLSKKNPDMDFALKQDRIYAKGPGETKWQVLDPSGFDPQDILDLPGDAVSLATSAIVGMKKPSLAAGLPGVVAQSVLGGGLEAAKQAGGVSAGVREKMDWPQVGEAAGVSGAFPALGAFVGASARSAAKLPFVNKFLGSVSGLSPEVVQAYLSNPGFKKEVQGILKDPSGQAYPKLIQSVTNPILDEAGHSKMMLGALLENVNKSADMVQPSGVSIVPLLDKVKKIEEELSTKVGAHPTPTDMENLAAVKRFLSDNFTTVDPTGNRVSLPDKISFEALQNIHTNLRDFIPTNYDKSASTVSGAVNKTTINLAKNLQRSIREIQDKELASLGNSAYEGLRTEYGYATDKKALMQKQLGDTSSAAKNLSKLDSTGDPVLKGYVDNSIAEVAKKDPGILDRLTKIKAIQDVESGSAARTAPNYRTLKLGSLGAIVGGSAGGPEHWGAGAFLGSALGAGAERFLSNPKSLTTGLTTLSSFGKPFEKFPYTLLPSLYNQGSSTLFSNIKSNEE